MTISILLTSDVHGRLDRFEEIIKQMKHLKADLIIDNGDFLHGSPATFYYEHIKPNIHPMIHLANELYDVAIFGNHEFNYPLSHIQQMRSQCQFPWISCNIKDFADPYFIKIIEGKKFVVIGATTHFTPLWDEHGYCSTLTFKSALETIQYWVSYVKTYEKPDYLIVAYHGGFSEDLITGAIYQERIGENQANEIIETVEGIDLLITGHQHLYFNERINNTLVVQPTSHGKGFMEVQVDFNHQHKQSTAIFHPINTSNLSYRNEVEKWLDKEIAYVPTDYTYSGLLTSRLTSHPYIQLLHDMQLTATNAQISVCDLLYLENGGFSGTVTNRDLLKNASREHTLNVIPLTGYEIKLLMEQSAAVFSINKDREIDFSTNVYPEKPQPYQYDFWGGLNYIIDVSHPVGKRIKEVSFNGEPVELTRDYKVVLNSYRLTGVDFPLLKNRPILYKTEVTVPFLLKEYLQNKPLLKIPQHGHFHVLK